MMKHDRRRLNAYLEYRNFQHSFTFNKSRVFLKWPLAQRSILRSANVLVRESGGLVQPNTTKARLAPSDRRATRLFHRFAASKTRRRDC
jgi:hypothetical protein